MPSFEILVRHAQSKNNNPNVTNCAHSYDCDLTKRGCEDANILATFLEGIVTLNHFKKIVIRGSTALRARRTMHSFLLLLDVLDITYTWHYLDLYKEFWTNGRRG